MKNLIKILFLSLIGFSSLAQDTKISNMTAADGSTTAIFPVVQSGANKKGTLGTNVLGALANNIGSAGAMVVNSSQSQNLFFASPNGSSGLGTFRALVNADLPTGTPNRLTEIGTVFTESWANLTSWANVGTPVASVSGGSLTLGGTSSISTNYITNTSYGKTNAEYGLYSWTINVSTIGSTTSGKPFGLQGQSVAAPNAVAVNLVLDNTGNAGKVQWYYNNSVTVAQTSDGVMTGITSGDIITCKMYVFPNRFVFQATNGTNGKTVYDVMYIKYPRTLLTQINGVLAGQMAFYNLGGNHTIGSFSYSILELKNSNLLVIGNSILQAKGDVNRWISRIMDRYEVSIVSNGMPSGITNDINVTEIGLYAPTKILITVGTNDVANNGVSTAETNYQSLVSALGGIGYSTSNNNLKFATLLPRGSSTYNTFNAFLLSTYGSSNVIDLNAVVSDGTINLPSKYTVDGIHPNQFATTALGEQVASAYGFKKKNNIAIPDILTDINPTNGNVIFSGNVTVGYNNVGATTSYISHGSSFLNNAWTANPNSTTSTIFGQDNTTSGAFGLYVDNGLTPLATFTPSLRLTINPNIGGASATDNAFRYNMTMPSVTSATTIANIFQVTGAGSSSFTSHAFRVNYLAGYTGSSPTTGIITVNNSAGTNTAAPSMSLPFGNMGHQAITTNISTTGYNFGLSGQALSGALNVGVIGQAQSAKNSGTNIGIVGFALNTGTSPVFQAGVFATYADATAIPTYSNSGLVADNGAQAIDIFGAYDNGAKKFSIADGGNPTLALGNRLMIGEGTNGASGSVALVSGTKAITITGVVAGTTHCGAFLDVQGGTVTTTVQYGCHVTTNTITITALDATKATVTTDTSTVSYFVWN